ncbi:MAG: ABC transporter substrate-binding protein, partial [Deltaproteobacteria bacterium]|nr:ABC transporter substrate-binding protein [Deltaproteobacteria bacterium]
MKLPIALLFFALFIFQAITRPVQGAQSQWSPALSAVIQEANKEGKLKLTWGEGTLGGSKGMINYENMMNKMFGTNIRIGFTPGPSMPQMGSRIATELAAGQSASSDVYIGAESYLVPLVKRKIFHVGEWPKLLPGRITPEMVEGDGMSLRILSGLPGTPYNTRRVPKNEAPKSLKDFLKPFWKGKIASTPYVTGLNLLGTKELWGREAALDFVRQFSKQVAGLIRCSEMERIVTGEFLSLVMDCNGASTFELEAQGAPLEHVIPSDAAMIRHFYLSIPKNAENPNAAKLFTTFLLTKEAQKLLWESDFADLYMFPESRIGQKVRKLEKQG